MYQADLSIFTTYNYAYAKINNCLRRVAILEGFDGRGKLCVSIKNALDAAFLHKKV